VHPLLYALNIGTLATWITLSGASTVAVAIKVHERLPTLNEVKPAEIELAFIDEVMGSAPPAAPEDAAVTEEDIPQEELPQPEEIPELPEIPEMPEVAELEPLPEIPDLPVKADGEIKPKPQPVVRRSSDQPKQATRTRTAVSRSGPAGNGSGQGAGTAKGSGSSATGNASRWVGLRKGRLNYPSAAKRAGEQGAVTVVFTVDERGYVVNARISKPCPYAQLNEAALAHVRRFKAKPGPRATNSQIVRFQLN
jgi:protein TonB